MLQLYVLQNLYTPSNEGTVAEMIDSCAFLEFCRVDSSNQVLDRDTSGWFQNLLIRNGITGEAVCPGNCATGGAGIVANEENNRGFVPDLRTVKYPKCRKQARSAGAFNDI